MKTETEIKANELLQELKNLCPNCDGSGTIANGVTKSQMDMEGNEIGTYIEWETEQCEWCYNFDQRAKLLTDQLCKEQIYNIWEPVMNSSIVEELDPILVEHLEDLILNAPMPDL